MITYNPDLVHQVVRAKMANKRRTIASTKDRAQVAGGGKKPWPQKGTGRARAGSNRSPLWKGGGITFGPSAQRIYKVNLTKKMVRTAIAMVFERKRRDKEVIVVDTIEVSEPKTKLFASWLKGVVEEPSVLVVADEHLSTLKRASRNIPGVKLQDPSNVDILDLLKYTYVVITKGALSQLEKRTESSPKQSSLKK